MLNYQVEQLAIALRKLAEGETQLECDTTQNGKTIWKVTPRS